jgi:hypothetical protein
MKTPVRGYAARRRFLGLSPALLTAITVSAALVGLWLTGIVDPTRWFRGPRTPDRRGLIAIPVAAVSIPSFTKVTRDHLWNPTTGSFALLYLRPDQVSPDMFRSLNAIIGRVTNHDKPPNYVFTEADFEPIGTRAGLVGGIPAGKRAMRIPVEKIPGLVELQPGDRFDLVATAPIEAGGAGATMGGGIYAKQLDLQARLTNWQKQATVRVVVQSGDVVEPMRTRQVPIASNTMTNGLVVRTKPVQEVVIAVLPHEVARLTEALTLNEDVECVPRSGRPDDPRDSITPDSMPISPFGGRVASPSGGTAGGLGAASGFSQGFTTIETINGTKRDMVGAPIKK